MKIRKTIEKITVQGIQCPVCEEKLWSKYTHDFHYCECTYCFVDGGREYLRIGWGAGSWSDLPNEKLPWEEVNEITEWIGKPELIEIEIDEPTPVREQEFPYPGYAAQLSAKKDYYRGRRSRR